MRKERSCEKKTYQKIIKRKMEETEDVKKGGQVREIVCERGKVKMRHTREI